QPKRFMKMKMASGVILNWFKTCAVVLAVAGNLSAAEREEQIVTVTAGGTEGTGPHPSADGANIRKRIVVKSTEAGGEKGKRGAELPWLGIATEEPSDALVSQLGLQPGEGLLVTYLAPD